MSWETIGTIGWKIVFLVIVVFLLFVFVKAVVGLLVNLSLGSKTRTEESISDPADRDDPVEDRPGLHVLSDFGSVHGLVDETPAEESIRATIRGLDWVGGFNQVVLVLSPGVSLEVGGSLNPDDGLSAVYRERRNNIFRCSVEPPTTIEDMEELLVSFYSGDGRWKQMYEFE